MFCPNCGKEQVEDSTFCHNCGQRLKPLGQETKQEQIIIQNNITETPKTPETGKTKTRHGCLTAYLIFLIIAAAIVVVYYIARVISLTATTGSPGWTTPVLVVLCLLEIVCAVALLRWKKWGFWGFCTIVVVTLIVNIASGLGIASSVISGLIGVAFLYGVLQIGDKANKGWPQLD